MNKGQLIDAVARELGDSRAAAGRAVDAVLGCVCAGIKRDESVTIMGFGTFTLKHRKARIGRSPATGETIEIEASTTIGFRPSQSLKEMMNDARTPVSV